MFYEEHQFLSTLMHMCIKIGSYLFFCPALKKKKIFILYQHPEVSKL